MKTKTINLDVCIITESDIHVSGSSTSYAGMSLCDFPNIDETKRKHSEIGRLSKKFGFQIKRKHQQLKLVKSSFEDAKTEYNTYKELFQQYFEMWKSFDIKNKKIDLSLAQNEIVDSYELRNKMMAFFYGGTKLNNYLSYSKSIEYFYQNAKNGEYDKNTTIYL